jgi:hypothetical protein
MADVQPESGPDGKALMDAWDYKGRPASRATTGGWACAAMTLGNLCRAHSFIFIFFLCSCCCPCMWKTNSSLWSREGVELFERMTTLGIAVNLVPYMTGTMHLGNAAAANTVTNFIGASFMLCLLGGFVADTYLGRYLTIAIFTAVQATVRSGCMGRPVSLCVRVVSHCHLLVTIQQQDTLADG